MEDNPFFLVEINVIKLRCEEVEVEIEDEGFIQIWFIVFVFFDVIFSLDSYHFFYKPLSDRRLDIVRNRALFMNETFHFFKILPIFRNIIFIVPEIGVLVDMDESIVLSEESSRPCFVPKIERMMMIIKYHHRNPIPIYSDEVPESRAGPEFSCFIGILEDNFLSEMDIIESSLDDRDMTSFFMHGFSCGLLYIPSFFNLSDHLLSYFFPRKSGRIDDDIVEIHIVDVDAIVFHVSFIFTCPSNLDIFRRLFETSVGFNSRTACIIENTSCCFFWIDGEEYFKSMGDEIERKSSVDNKIILCKSELLLSFIENCIDYTPVIFRLSSEFEQRNTSLESHISHKIAG